MNETERPTINSASSWFVLSPSSTVSIDLPRRITVIRSATARISSNLCVMRMIDLPSLIKFFMICINSEISAGVKTAVGSSKIKISAPR